MKKKSIYILCIVFGVLLFGGVVFLAFHKYNPKLQNGIYKLQNSLTYQDAYIQVEDGYAQFFGIDLNEIYKKKIADQYVNYLVNYKKQTLSDKEKEEVKASIDLNEMFCKQKFVLDYETIHLQDEDKGYLHEYSFGYVTESSYLSYTYNAKDKSIIINNEGTEKALEFKMQK